jgi:hypothetical protein
LPHFGVFILHYASPLFVQQRQKKRLYNYVRYRNRKTDKLLQSDANASLAAVCCTCGLEASEGVLLQIAEYSNEVYCGSCYHSCESTQGGTIPELTVMRVGKMHQGRAL